MVCKIDVRMRVFLCVPLSDKSSSFANLPISLEQSVLSLGETGPSFIGLLAWSGISSGFCVPSLSDKSSSLSDLLTSLDQSTLSLDKTRSSFVDLLVSSEISSDEKMQRRTANQMDFHQAGHIFGL